MWKKMKKEQIEEFVDIIGEFVAGLAIISVVVLSIYYFARTESEFTRSFMESAIVLFALGAMGILGIYTVLDAFNRLLELIKRK
jgi:heme A synthase